MPEIPSVGTVIIVGFGLVFVILVVLVVILSLQGRFFQNLDKNKSAKANEVVKAAAIVPGDEKLHRELFERLIDKKRKVDFIRLVTSLSHCDDAQWIKDMEI